METIESLHERVEAMEYRGRITERRLFWWRILACSSVVLGVVILPLIGGTAQEQSAYERALARRLAALEYKLQYITGGANEVVIKSFINTPYLSVGYPTKVIGSKVGRATMRDSTGFLSTHFPCQEGCYCD
jgi:hypothetical protein